MTFWHQIEQLRKKIIEFPYLQSFLSHNLTLDEMINHLSEEKNNVWNNFNINPHSNNRMFMEVNHEKTFSKTKRFDSG